MARPLFHFVHRSDFLQHHGGPLGIAGLLVARASTGSQDTHGAQKGRAPLRPFLLFFIILVSFNTISFAF
jgi:hypothetical protein